MSHSSPTVQEDLAWVPWYDLFLQKFHSTGCQLHYTIIRFPKEDGTGTLSLDWKAEDMLKPSQVCPILQSCPSSSRCQPPLCPPNGRIEPRSGDSPASVSPGVSPSRCLCQPKTPSPGKQVFHHRTRVPCRFIWNTKVQLLFAWLRVHPWSWSQGPCLSSDLQRKERPPPSMRFWSTSL